MSENVMIINMEHQPSGILEILEKHSVAPYYQNSGVDELLRAFPMTTTRNMAVKMFLLGYISGKRAERAKRKK